VVVAVTIVVFVLVAIAGIVVLGVTFGSKESSPAAAPTTPEATTESNPAGALTQEMTSTCQERCKGLLTGTPVTVNGVEFEQAIFQYLKNLSSSPYGSVINCWDVSQVSLLEDASSTFVQFFLQ
jgi:hypothetical protein